MSRILDALFRHAQCNAEKIAVQGDETSLSWQDLEKASGKLGALLEGVCCLGLFLENSPAWVVADIAALRQGVICVPVPGFFSNRQKQHVLKDTGMDVLLCDDENLLALLDDSWSVEPVAVAGQALLLARRSGKPVPIHPGTAKITFTSGTTGMPKGVCLGLEAMEQVAQSLSELSDASSRDRVLALLPLGILLENIGSIYVPILSGACMLLPSSQSLGRMGSGSMDARKLGACLRRLEPSALIVPPQLLKLLMGLAATGQLPKSFRFLAVGGAMLAETQLEKAQELGLPVYQGYGLSETASVVAMNIPGNSRPGSVGKVLPHNELCISPQGEILVRGNLFQGYLHQKGWNPQDFFPTGDLGYLDEQGFLYVTGRRKNLIITAYGRNVSAEWPEAELLAEPELIQAVVFGDARPWLSAVLVPAPGVARSNLHQALVRVNQRLPDYARIVDYLIAEEPFSLSNDMVTANGRPRRENIYNYYRHQLNALYKREQSRVL